MDRSAGLMTVGRFRYGGFVMAFGWAGDVAWESRSESVRLSIDKEHVECGR